jgi:hypothetical protein
MNEPERYSPMPMAPQPQRRPRSKIVPWLLGCAGLALLVVVVAVAILVSWGWSLFSRQAKTALSENPVIQTHLGEVREARFDLWATGSEPTDAFAFKVVGTKGRGMAIADFETVDGDTERIASGVLKLDNGQSYDLVPDDQNPPR